MNSTLALIINVPTLFLLYILTYFTQALSGKRQFYGIPENVTNLYKKFKEHPTGFATQIQPEHIFSPETVFVARRVFAMSKPICGCTYGTCSVRRRNAPRKDIPSRSVRKTRCGR